MDIHKAGGLLIQNRRLLLNRQGGSDVYIVPGGQIEHGETSSQALIRELNEEFQISVLESDLQAIGGFDSPAVHNPGKIVRISLFWVKHWMGEIQPSQEVEGITWVNSAVVWKLKVSPFTTAIAVPWLLSQNLID